MNLPAVGDVINERYRLESVLGDGGFGTVYRATDLQTHTIVAVKVLHPDDGDDYLSATRRRFEREVAVLMQLRNPHTVQLLGYGTTPSRLLFLVFEFLPGRDLDELLHDGPLAAALAKHILRQVLNSLADAHRAGLSHRDIKPANIRVLQTPDDPFFVKLIDFGIARSTARERMAVTTTGELIGTPRYMSPEQLRDQELTPASDIYSLGVVLVEMLAGPGPLYGDNLGSQLVRLMDGHRFDVPTTGDGRLDFVVHKMTAANPQDRFRTVGQVLDALDGAAAVVPADATSQRRSVALWATLAAVLAVVLVGIVVLTEGIAEKVTPAPGPVADERRITPSLVRVDARQPDVRPVVKDAPLAIDAGADMEGGCEPRFRGIGVIDGAVPGDNPIYAYVPAAELTEPPPLVIFLHSRYDTPGKENLDKWLEVSGMAELAEQKRFAVITPVDQEALADEPWQELEDVERLKRWVSVASKDLCIDTTRVFAVGQSESAFLHHLLSCEDWITAVAFNSTRTAPGKIDRCGARPLPAIWITPRNTKRLPAQGGSGCREWPPIPELGTLGGLVQNVKAGQKRGTAFSLERLRKQITDLHGCDVPGERIFHDPGHALCFEWECEIPLRYCAHNGGEPWPGTGTVDPCAGEAATFPVGERIWDFFESVPSLKAK